MDGFRGFNLKSCFLLREGRSLSLCVRLINDVHGVLATCNGCDHWNHINCYIDDEASDGCQQKTSPFSWLDRINH
ncbi:hypothetical protein D3C80_1912870 [compost metagenome]